MKHPVVLLYQIPEQEKVRLMQILRLHQCSAVTVAKEQYGTALGVLAGMAEAKEAAPVYKGKELPESMMVFCGCSDAQLDSLLSALRKAGVQIGLKAVLTPSNQYWTAGMLYFELAKERQAFLDLQKKKL